MLSLLGVDKGIGDVTAAVPRFSYFSFLCFYDFIVFNIVTHWSCY